MAYTTSVDERYIGGVSQQKAGLYDAAFNLGTSYILGQYSTAYGALVLTSSGRDLDAYALGTLNAGSITVNATSTTWDATSTLWGSAAYWMYFRPTVYIYDAAGQVIASGYGSATYQINYASAGNFYIGVEGSSSGSSQYAVSYTYQAPIDYAPTIGTLAINGTLLDGSLVTLTGNFNDVNGTSLANTSGGYSYRWYTCADNSSSLANWTLVSTNSTYTLKSADLGKYIDVYISYRDDQGFQNTISPVSVYIPLVNRPPELNGTLPSQNWIEGTLLHYTVPTGTFTDPEGYSLSYTATLANGSALPTWLNFSSTTQVFSGVAPAGSPDYTVRIIAKDNAGQSTFTDMTFLTPAALKLASIVPFSPTTGIEKALFNFDSAGISNYQLSGTVYVSVSDAFTYTQYLANPRLISSDIYTSLASGKTTWTATQLANINLITSTYHNFINLSFSPVSDYSGNTPFDLASLSNINISIIYRPDAKYSGESALGTDDNFGYFGSASDIVLNLAGFGSQGLNNDESLDGSTFGFHALMHEIGHSLGLSHPHSAYVNGVTTLTADYGLTSTVGFEKLGFQIKSPSDMNKEYFSVMSYDDINPAGTADTFAQTPMILDLIALQGAYGEGQGSTGSANDTIAPGGTGGVNSYRAYFDTGGTDLIDLKNYAAGAYLHMGTSITGATHLVGVAMSMADEIKMIGGGDPASLRWFYGEYENAAGSVGADLIIGNNGNNSILGNDGNDTLSGGSGNDTIDGGGGSDTVQFQGRLSNYKVTMTGTSGTITDSNLARDGVDALSNIEHLRFTDFDINTGIKALAASMNTATVQRVMELYVAFFNRTPDADGLSYWLGQSKAGTSTTQIAESFYGVGVQYTSLTGFSSTMTTTDFINVVYRNVLGRTGGADAGGLDYWTQKLTSGEDTRGSLVSKILDAAHTYKGDATYGWVANLLDNKITVATKVAVDWGLNYLTADASVTNGMAIAKAVTPTDTTAAIALVGVPEGAVAIG